MRPRKGAAAHEPRDQMGQQQYFSTAEQSETKRWGSARIMQRRRTRAQAVVHLGERVDLQRQSDQTFPHEAVVLAWAECLVRAWVCVSSAGR